MGRNRCEEPTCRRKFKTSLGHSVHIGRSARCAEWYHRNHVQSVELEAEGNESGPGSESEDEDEDAMDEDEDALDGDEDDSNLDLSISSETDSDSEIVYKPYRPHPRRTRPRRQSIHSPASSQVEGASENASGDDPEQPLDQTDDETMFESVKTHPRAGKSYGKGVTVVEQIDIDDPDSAEKRKSNLYYPFMNKDDWQVSSWLASSGLSMVEIDKFLHFDFVS